MEAKRKHKGISAAISSSHVPSVATCRLVSSRGVLNHPLTAVCAVLYNLINFQIFGLPRFLCNRWRLLPCHILPPTLCSRSADWLSDGHASHVARARHHMPFPPPPTRSHSRQPPKKSSPSSSISFLICFLSRCLYAPFLSLCVARSGLCPCCPHTPDSCSAFLRFCTTCLTPTPPPTTGF